MLACAAHRSVALTKLFTPSDSFARNHAETELGKLFYSSNAVCIVLVS